MEEYHETVANVITVESVGGSEDCLEAVAQGHSEIGEMLKSDEGRRNLEKLFNVCVPGSLDDRKNQKVPISSEYM